MSEPGTTRPSLYWEDFPVGSVREFDGPTVSRDEIIDFARRFDPQPFHLDEEAARQTHYGGLIASGWHTASMAMRTMCDGYLHDTASLGSPGVDKLRWTAPVRPGDTLRLRMTVLSARPMKSRPHIGLLESHWEMFNQRGELVLDMSGWGMFGRREADAPAEP
jgi:acyl dehydratase